ncbi:MAG TPA: hypothetical protein VOA80_16510 [Thermoanaerobaculia bacterium]|nr:hypothetical protein [Thermoanaerobaculia bacterium]
MRRVTVVLLALGLLGTAAAAEDIGIAMLVRPEVRGFPPGQPSRDLVARDPIERGLRVLLTSKEAFLQVYLTRAFGGNQGARNFDGRKISGVLTLVGAGDAGLGDSERSHAPKLRFNRGKFKLSLLPGEPPIDVDTPEAVSGVHGTDAGFFVDPKVGTFVRVYEGVVTVQAKAGGDPVEVEAGQWVLVPPGGLATRPAPLQHLDEPDDSPIRLSDFTTQPAARPHR